MGSETHLENSNELIQSFGLGQWTWSALNTGDGAVGSWPVWAGQLHCCSVYICTLQRQRTFPSLMFSSVWYVSRLSQVRFFFSMFTYNDVQDSTLRFFGWGRFPCKWKEQSKVLICFSKRTENVTPKAFSWQRQKKFVEVWQDRALYSRGDLCLLESLASCSWAEIAVSQILQGRASPQRRASWALQSWVHNSECISGRDGGEKNGACVWSSSFLSYAPGALCSFCSWWC